MQNYNYERSAGFRVGTGGPERLGSQFSQG